MLSPLEIIIRLVLSAILGGLIGMEREVSNRPAGLRTHVLVTLGSALIMLISIDGFYFGGEGLQGDPARLAAQVVSGIGFLGAGTIMRTGNNIVGLTTAASLWVSAGIGLAIGNGYYLGAIITSSIVLLTLMSLGTLEKKTLKRKYRTIEISGANRPGLIGNVGTLFGKHGVSIKNIYILDQDSENEEENSIINVNFLVNIPAGININKFYREIYKTKGVISVNIEGVNIVNYDDRTYSIFDVDEEE